MLPTDFNAWMTVVGCVTVIVGSLYVLRLLGLE